MNEQTPKNYHERAFTCSFELGGFVEIKATGHDLNIVTQQASAAFEAAVAQSPVQQLDTPLLECELSYWELDEDLQSFQLKCSESDCPDIKTILEVVQATRCMLGRVLPAFVARLALNQIILDNGKLV